MLRGIVFIVLMVIAIRGAFASAFGALLAYLWFGLFRPEDWVWFDIRSMRLSLILGLLLVVRSIASGVRPKITHRLTLGMLLFLGTGLIAQIHAVRPDVGWHWIGYFVRLCVVCVFLVLLVDSPRRLLLAVMVICSSIGYYTAKAGLMSLLGGGERFGAGLTGAFVDNNAYALAAVMIAPMLAAVARSIPSEWRFRKALVWGYRAAVPLTCYTAISTFSREGFLALLVMAIGYLILMIRRRALTILLVLTAVLIIAPILPLPSGYTNRLDTIITYRKVHDDSALSRLYFWQVAWNMAKDHPLGVGMYNFNYTFDQYDYLNGKYGRGRSVHNSHLEALTENGFDGLAVWIGMFISAIATCVRVRKRARHELQGSPEGELLWHMGGALLISMIAFLVGGTFIALSLNDLTWITFALVAALDRICESATRAVKNEQSSRVPNNQRIDRPAL